MGIGDSQGRIHDFAGPYTIGVDNFMVLPTLICHPRPRLMTVRSSNWFKVGTVWRYAPVRGADKDPDWDAAVEQADNK